MITALCLGLLPVQVDLNVEVSPFHLAGGSFRVELIYEVGDAPAELEPWRFTPAALEVDGEPLGERTGDASVELPAGSRVSVAWDVGDQLPDADFTLKPAEVDERKPFTPYEVRVFQPAPEGLDFMEMPAEGLQDYQVLLRTNQGDMLLDLRPDLAPNHVRNFLDLSYTDFYDGTSFHRVSPTFMIQGGDPNTKAGDRGSWGTGSGPRKLQAEFTSEPHKRGVLSMARGPSPDSASSQFFIMTADAPNLDNQYTVFGKLVWGEEALDRIANAPGRRNPRDGTVQPSDPQRIDEALVVKKAPSAVGGVPGEGE